MLARQLTRCLRARSFSLRAGIAYADAYAGLRTPGFCLREVLIATLLRNMNKKVFDVAICVTSNIVNEVFKIRPH